MRPETEAPYRIGPVGIGLRIQAEAFHELGDTPVNAICHTARIRCCWESASKAVLKVPRGGRDRASAGHSHSLLRDP